MRWKTSYPAPTPENLFKKLTCCVTPDINAAQSKAAGSPRRPTLHVRPGTQLAGRAGGPRESGTAYHLPLDKVRGAPPSRSSWP